MKIPVIPPKVDTLIAKLIENPAKPERLIEIVGLRVGPAPRGEYLHWDKLRHLTPPNNLSTEEWWLAAKMARLSLARTLHFRDKHGRPFFYTMPDIALSLLHQLDRAVSEHVSGTEQITNPQTRDSYMIRSLIEESITSSQLEGASTTRQVAKDMLREGRKPATHGEQMIFNNYRAMQFIREYIKDEMTPSIIIELHRILIVNTRNDHSAAGRLRREEDDIHVVDNRDSEVLHTPPAASELTNRMKYLCDFANEKNTEPFMHPAIRAIILHFMLGYDHPFTDGNGRTARALFYWSMLNQGYPLIEYLSISRILKAAPSEYARAYLYTETDEGDVTYFIVHQLKTILRAIRDLNQYLERKVSEVHEIEDIIRKSPTLRNRLNHRQIALLGHAMRRPNSTYRIQFHKQSHNVTYDTARTDLLELAELKLLEKSRVGKAFVFISPENLTERIQKLNKTDSKTRRS